MTLVEGIAKSVLTSEAEDRWNDWAEEHLNGRDPYYEKSNGKTKRRKAPPGATDLEKRVWKKSVKMAFVHDKCMCGCFWCGCCGLGLSPFLSIIPVIGPALMYVIHLRMNDIAEELGVPPSMIAKMSANVLFDFLISLPPIIGTFLTWMNGASTRNAAMIQHYIEKQIRNRNLEAQQQQQQLHGNGRQQAAPTRPGHAAQSYSHQQARTNPRQQESIPMNNINGNGSSRQAQRQQKPLVPAGYPLGYDSPYDGAYRDQPSIPPQQSATFQPAPQQVEYVDTRGMSEFQKWKLKKQYERGA